MRIFVMSLILLCCAPAFGQTTTTAAETQTQQQPTESTRPINVALKTNMLADALLNVNFGAEVGIAPRWTLDVAAELNTWTLSHYRRWKHWYVQPEARYWLKNRFRGHFFGVHVFGGQYNIGNLKNDIMLLGTDFGNLSDRRYQGWMLGAGVAYGYTWHFDKHWSLEGELGIGYAGSHYKIFSCKGCGKVLKDHQTHNYFGPTKAAVNLVYVF
jgi:hypothetical protein